MKRRTKLKILLSQNNHHTAFHLLIHRSKFDGNNYDLQEQAVRTALKAKNKLSFIDGKITKPKVNEWEISAEATAWDIVNSMITSWIINVIDPKLHISVAHSKSICEIKENIKKKYSMPNIPRIHKLKSESASCTQGNLEVVEFLSKLMSPWNELANYV